MNSRTTMAFLASALALAAMANTISHATAASMQVAESRWARPTTKPEETKPQAAEPTTKRSSPEREVPGSATDRKRLVPGDVAGEKPAEDVKRTRQEASRLSPEEWKQERERLRAEINEQLQLRKARGPDDLDLATIKDDPRVHMRFRKHNESVDIEEIVTRDLEKGAGSVFASEALIRSGNLPDKTIRLRNIIEETTLEELKAGKQPQETKLGRFGTAVAEDIGRKIRQVRIEDQVSDYGTRTARRDMVFVLE